MKTIDRQYFLVALSSMGEFFSDELSELRQDIYWKTFEPICTLDEWEYACKAAILRESFHKVPLPAKLLEYIAQYRLEGEDRARSSRQAIEARETADMARRAADRASALQQIEADEARITPGAAERFRLSLQEGSHNGQSA